MVGNYWIKIGRKNIKGTVISVEKDTKKYIFGNVN